MSFPSVQSVLKERNVDLAIADAHTLIHVLWDALQRDLGEGVSELKRAAHELKESLDSRMLVDIPRDSHLGKQLIRMVGTDAARPACEHALGVHLALYYPCVVVLAKTAEDLGITTREQIEILVSHGFFTSDACRLEDQYLERLLVSWFTQRFPLGESHVLDMIRDASETPDERVKRPLDPNSEAGLQTAAIMGAHVARRSFARMHDVSLSFLNCCAPAAIKRPGPERDDAPGPLPPKRGDRPIRDGQRSEDSSLVVTLREQIAMQATADC